MALSDALERDLASIRLPRWGRVVAVEGVMPWLVVDPAGDAVEPIQRFLRDFVARGNRIGSVRSYAYCLLRWCGGWWPSAWIGTKRRRLRSGTLCCGWGGPRSSAIR